MEDLKLLFLDSETTDVDPEKAKIWELAFARCKKGLLGKPLVRLFKPPDPIPEDVINLCQLTTDEDVGDLEESDLAEIMSSKTFYEVARPLAAWLQKQADAGWIFVAYNGIEYDWRLLEVEAARAGVAWPLLGPPDVGLRATVVMFDPMVWVRALYRGARVRSLAGAYKGLVGGDFVQTHRAPDDCVMTHAVTFKIIERHPEIFSQSLYDIWVWQETHRIHQKGQFELYSYYCYESAEGLRIGFGDSCGLLMTEDRSFCKWALKKCRGEMPQAALKAFQGVAFPGQQEMKL